MDYQSDYSGLGSASTTTSSGSFLNWFRSITWQTWIIIILVLAVLGFNIFYYLGKGTQTVANFFAPIMSYFGNAAIDTTRQVINTSANGVAGGAVATAGAIDTGLTAVQGATVQTQMQGSPIITTTTGQSQNANNSLSNALHSQKGGESPEPDYANSNIQSGNNPEGWCYIGTEQGFRSCAEVGVNDKCMSGDIFPTQAICVNPNLRQ